MSTIGEIEAAIEGLPKHQMEELARWHLRVVAPVAFMQQWSRYIWSAAHANV